MNSLVLVIGSAIMYIVAYNTYGRFLGKKIFKLTKDNICPSEELRDDHDYVPTHPQVLFGHHFASIAGTGPIVGPAIAIIWGWLPALLWIVFGSIFMGAVHDFGSLVVSLRNKGRSIGDIAGDLISPRVRTLFLLIIFFLLLLVVAVFGVVIGLCFKLYPQAVIPVWTQIPIAVALGYLVYKKNMSVLVLGAIAVLLMYGSIILGAYFPLSMPAIKSGSKVILDPISIWIVILLIYVYIASILPVQTLLQPRDFINSWQLMVAMLLLGLGVIVAHPQMTAPTYRTVADAPPMLPMIFVTIACGALSGFHSLVSSGTSSKQCDNEHTALFVGYGSMLVEGMLAIFVLVACGAGIALAGGGEEAYFSRYANWAAANGLGAKLDAFVVGAGAMIDDVGVPNAVAQTLMGVFIVSFAATSLDSATRIQRYIVSELADIFKVPILKKKHPATMFAVGTAAALAFFNGSGQGAVQLWPLFGCLNQLLGGLALLVVTIYLIHKKMPIIYTAIPMVFMLAMTAWGMYYNIDRFSSQGNWALLSISIVIIIFEIWMIVESVAIIKKAKSP
jgi:carbon starvation protein